MELLDIYDDNGNITGKTIIRGDKNTKLNENEHIALSVIFIQNDNGKFLIQKTSEKKGGKYSSTGGHVDSGETPLEAIKREVKEEIGINIDNDKIEEYGFLSYDKPLRYMYYLRKDIDIKDVKVQKEEVDYVKYMSVQEIEKLIENEEMLKSHGFIFEAIMKKLNSKKVKTKNNV